MLHQVETMLRLQDDMNTRIHPEWRAQGNAWYRAIWVESAEMLDHYGWKWWKQQTPDLEQVRLELVDIWHFGLSILLEGSVPADEVASRLASGLEAGGNLDFCRDLESFVAETLRSRDFYLAGFARLMRGVDLSAGELFIVMWAKMCSTSSARITVIRTAATVRSGTGERTMTTWSKLSVFWIRSRAISPSASMLNSSNVTTRPVERFSCSTPPSKSTRRT